MEVPPGEAGQRPEGGAAAAAGAGEPLLVAELKPGRPQQYDWKSSCETWSVAFSPDGAWFAWSQGHCVVKLLPWPLEGTDQFFFITFHPSLWPSSSEDRSITLCSVEFLLQSSEDAGHRDWRNIKNHLQNTAKEPKKPTTIVQFIEKSRKALECKSQYLKNEVKRRGAGAKEKTLECGQIVWGLAFSSWLPSPSKKHIVRGPSTSCLVLATGLNDGQIKVWEVQTGCLLFNLLGHQDVVRDLSFAPGESSSILVSASRDKTLRVWDLSQNGKQLKVLSGHVQWVYCCSISPDGQILCSAAGEKSALLWSMCSYSLLRRLEGHQGCVVSCDFSPDSALLATASYDTLVILWDPCTGEQLRSLCHIPLQSFVDQSSDFHVNSLRSVCFSPEGLYLATVADDRLLRIWALDLGIPVAFAPVKNGLCCTYFPHGGIIATGTRDGHTQFWTAPQALSSLKHLCRKVIRSCYSTQQVQQLPIPKKMKEFLTYRTL